MVWIATARAEGEHALQTVTKRLLRVPLDEHDELTARTVLDVTHRLQRFLQYTQENMYIDCLAVNVLA